VYRVISIQQLRQGEVENLRSRKGGVLTPNDGYGVYALVIDRDKEMKCGGGVGSVWGGVDSTVEAVGDGELEIAQGRGF
jgi:predicted lipoprotein with Yx(FWY)xxD motif